MPTFLCDLQAIIIGNVLHRMQTCVGVHTYYVQVMVRRRTADCIRLGGQVVVVVYYQRASPVWEPLWAWLDLVAVDAEAETEAGNSRRNVFHLHALTHTPYCAAR